MRVGESDSLAIVAEECALRGVALHAGPQASSGGRAVRTCNVRNLACKVARRGKQADDGCMFSIDGGRVGASDNSESLLSVLAISTPPKQLSTKLLKCTSVERDPACDPNAMARATTSGMVGRSAGEALSIAESKATTAEGTYCMPMGISTLPRPVTSGGLPAKIATPSTPSAHTSAACSVEAVA